MVKEIIIPKENKAQIEEVREIENEYPSYEDFMKTYEIDKKVSESYANELGSYGDLMASRSYGPGPVHSVLDSSGQFERFCETFDLIANDPIRRARNEWLEEKLKDFIEKTREQKNSSNSNTFSINYSFNHEEVDEKIFFEKNGTYSNSWEISGNIQDLHNEALKLIKDEIKIVKVVNGSYFEDIQQWKEIVKQLAEDIDEFTEMEKNGWVKYNGIGREFGGSQIRSID